MKMNQQQINEMNERFESAIREKLTGFEPEVPHALWSKISAELNQQEFKTAEEIKTVVAIPIWKNWKVAAAVAIVISMGGGLFMLQNQTNETKSTLNSTTATNNVILPTIENSVAVSKKPEILASVKTVSAKATSTKNKSVESKIELVSPISASEPDTKDDFLVAQNNESLTTKENNTVDMGSIPMFSLKIMSSPTSLNDEITIIQSVQDKKYHNKSKADKTKVIFMGKKFDKKPAIDYTIPVRF